MNLIYFDFSDQEFLFYFNNIEIKEFLKLFPGTQCIAVNSLFAHTPAREFNELDFSKRITIKDLNMFKEENQSVFIDSINFSVDSLIVNLSDEYEYRVSSVEPYFTDFINKLYDLLKINDTIWNEVQQNISKYVLIENGSIIRIFSTFDEYLQSEYSSMM